MCKHTCLGKGILTKMCGRIVASGKVSNAARLLRSLYVVQKHSLRIVQSQRLMKLQTATAAVLISFLCPMLGWFARQLWATRMCDWWVSFNQDVGLSGTLECSFRILCQNKLLMIHSKMRLLKSNQRSASKQQPMSGDHSWACVVHVVSSLPYVVLERNLS